MPHITTHLRATQEGPLKEMIYSSSAFGEVFAKEFVSQARGLTGKERKQAFDAIRQIIISKPYVIDGEPVGGYLLLRAMVRDVNGFTGACIKIGLLYQMEREAEDYRDPPMIWPFIRDFREIGLELLEETVANMSCLDERERLRANPDLPTDMVRIVYAFYRQIKQIAALIRPDAEIFKHPGLLLGTINDGLQLGRRHVTFVDDLEGRIALNSKRCKTQWLVINEVYMTIMLSVLMFDSGVRKHHLQDYMEEHGPGTLRQFLSHIDAEEINYEEAARIILNNEPPSP